MDEAPRETASTRSLAAYAVLAAAVALAAAATLYLVLSGDDGDSSLPRDDIVPTAVPNLPGAPTPPSNTGVLDPQRPETGKVAPNFALPDARAPSTVRQLTDYRGRVFVLIFWATWCGPCKAEMPEFEAAQKALGDDVVVLAVNYRESPDRAVQFLDELQTTFPALLDGSGKVAEHYRVPGLPVTYFLDRDGVVRHIEQGPVSVEELERYLTEAGAPYAAPN